MKSIRIALLSALGLVLVGCGAAESGPRVIKIEANDQMQFNKKSFRAKVGEELKIVLTNVGKLPVETMGHNLVILKPGTKTMDFGAAAATAKDTGYIPDSMKNVVEKHTKLLGPGETDTIVWKPTAAGDYPFLCSFPGHVASMKGQITVKP